ncbi:hypothetical protein CXB51_016110 [Gossypium anomalum]|uniref:Auxin-responsive protein n=1 Tax=Gossypium anomalum TaxID=47600 RepID=A0A8J5Z7N2_9ROSI|nr:hypothetical protein CXB51_016110 [Gossypium anomalum]
MADKALSLEVSRLQNLHHEGQNKDGKLDIIPTVSPRIAQVSSEKVSGRSIGMMTRKCSRESAAETNGNIITSVSTNCNVAMTNALAEDLSEKGLSREDLTHFQPPECCKRSPDASARATARATCLFQALTECLLDMKISTNNQTGGLCISALHQSSGLCLDVFLVPYSTTEFNLFQFHPGRTRNEDDYILTYQDKEGEWLIAGDIPWQ